MKKTCQTYHPTILSAFVDHELEAAEQNAVRHHIETCESCRRIVDRYQALSDSAAKVIDIGVKGIDTSAMARQVREKVAVFDSFTLTSKVKKVFDYFSVKSYVKVATVAAMMVIAVVFYQERTMTMGVQEPSAIVKSVDAIAAEEAPSEMPEGAADVDGAHDPEDEEKRDPFFRRWASRIGQTLRRTGPEPEEVETSEAASEPDAVLLFAYRPDPVPLRDANGNVQLPGDLIPLCELRYAQHLRPEAARIVQVFAQTGVSVKAFSSDEPDQIVTLFQRAGLGQVEDDPLGVVGAISGQDLEALPRTEWARAASEHAVFGHVTPEQAGALVRALRECGESVAVVGDGVTDLPALQQANLAIARQTSTQAALGVADVVMMGSSPEALLQVLEKGQRIVHGLLDVLKLNLVQISCLALLIAAIQVASIGFPYASAQGAAIAAITVTLPSVALPFWASSGRVSSERFGQILTHFVAPAAVSMGLAGLLVYIYFLNGTGRLAYAQLAVTYTLLYAGLLLAVFVKPPWHASREEKDGARKQDWRMTGLVLFLGIATFFLPAVPAAQQHLKLNWLSQPADYGVIGLVVVAWAVMLNLVWWVMSLIGGHQDDRAPAEPA